MRNLFPESQSWAIISSMPIKRSPLKGIAPVILINSYMPVIGTKEYFDQLRIWGANIVRFPVHPQAWRKHGKANYLTLLDQGIQYAKEAGLYVIIDWHSIGNLKSELFNRIIMKLPERKPTSSGVLWPPI